MKLRNVKYNNRKKTFQVETQDRTLSYPYSKLKVQPTSTDRIVHVYVDGEIGNEGFTYALESGREGTVHLDQVLDYNRDPGYLKDLLLYKLSLEARKRVQASPLSKREIIRRLGTSATQLYRLLDQTNYKKSLGQLISLLHILDCDVDLVVKPKETKS